MRSIIFYIKERLVFAALAMTALLMPGIVNAQCEWSIAPPVTDSSRCAASGSISVSLTGANTGNLSNIRYGLTALSGSVFNVPLNASNVFANVPAGTFRVQVLALCNGQDISRTVDVAVPGNYQAPVASSIATRRPLPNCGTGIITVSTSNGRKPYHINLISTPAGYTGPVSFTTTSNSFVVNGLTGGNYTISVSDECGATAAQQVVNLPVLPPLSAIEIQNTGFTRVGASCDIVLAARPDIKITSLYNAYIPALVWAVGYEGGPKSAYRPLTEFSQQIPLPAGLTAKDVYGDTLNYYLKDTCGGAEFTYNFANIKPYPALSAVLNCSNFDMSYSFYYGGVCGPVFSRIQRQGTNEYYYDTIPAGGTGIFENLPFGVYNFQATTADGHIISFNNYVVNPPDNEPYYLQLSPSGGQGIYGNDRATGFQIAKKSGLMKAGTRVDLIGPTTYPFSATATSALGWFYIYAANVEPTAPNRWFRPGDYLFRVTDECGSYDLPVTVQESDVYRYTMSYMQAQTCNGLQIIPNGVAMYQEQEVPSYYRIIYGPAGGYSTATVAKGEPILLNIPGKYLLGMSAQPNGIHDYTSTGGTGANLVEIDYAYTPLAIDVDHTRGWVCPGAPLNAGTITAIAINGGSPAGSTFTYKLAAAGNGATGPYLAVNNTGQFSTATSGGTYELIAGQSYDIRVEDVCGAAAVQTVKIANLGAGQLISLDKMLYCVGDPVRFQVLSLAGEGFTYEWTGPANFISYQRSPLISRITPERAGIYTVKIQATGICASEIRDTVEVSLAPYREICYSAVTDTTVNPYTVGLLGNWRPSRSYVYYGARAESDPSQPTNIRNDGAYQTFSAFWKLQQQKWKAQQDTTRWVWNAEAILFNRKGFELENKDPLGRYNAAIYGYDDAFPIAAAQNSRYREVAYEGFEDYGFTSAQCNTSCPAARRFDFTGYSNRFDTTEHHSGRYSLRVQPQDTIVMLTPVTDTAFSMVNPAFVMGATACLAQQVLKSVNAGQSVLLPAFSPMAGKKVLFSAWVKEAQDCKCQSYTNNRVDLIVQKPDGNILIQAHPQGSIIDGWQRYEQVIDLPAGTTGLSMVLLATGNVNVYFDDIRVHPFNANMKSFVYDATTLQMMAELDENNYATFYEYDDDGSLIRVKKETERGVKTIKETRSALIKEDVE